MTADATALGDFFTAATSHLRGDNELQLLLKILPRQRLLRLYWGAPCQRFETVEVEKDIYMIN